MYTKVLVNYLVSARKSVARSKIPTLRDLKVVVRASLGAALVASCFIADPAKAEYAPLQPTIEVTATRVAETVDASLADVDVITRSDIDTSHAQDLIDLLRLHAGVDVARTGGAGEQTSIFLRGTNSNHVLVLIDGIRIGSFNTGVFAFENLPLDAVERIEIVRGPRAAYWGSGAIGGVIQIFTRKLNGPHLAASYGSYRSADGSVGYGATSDEGGFSVQAGARHVGGFSASNAAAGPYVFNPDDNGFQNHNVTAQGNYKLGTQILSATIFRSAGTQSFDNGDFGPGISHTLDTTIGTSLAGAVTDSWQQRLTLGTSREDIDTAVFSTAYRSTRDELGWTNDIALTPTQHLIAGVDYLHDHGISLDTSAALPVYDTTRHDEAAFGGWHVQDGAFGSELSGRYDHDSTFGSAFSGAAAIGYHLSDDWRISASYGTAFRAPTLNELYSPGYSGYYAGNPLLDPERSRTAELGIQWRWDDANDLKARAFSTRIHNLIDFSGGDFFQAINVDHAAIDGLELIHAWHYAGWTWNNTVTLQNPRNVDTDTQLLRRPKQKFSSVLETALSDALHAGFEFSASGRSHDAGDVTLGGYALINLRATWDINRSFSVGARLENLLDHEYEIVHGYNTAGRSGYLTLTFQPH